jgi:DNA-binding SARP family transcriptional activator
MAEPPSRRQAGADEPPAALPEPSATAGLTVWLLGDFRVACRGLALPDSAWTRRKARQLFKCLLSRPRRRLSQDEAIELFWPESPPGAAAQTLRSTLHSLRRALRQGGLEADLVVVEGGTIALDPRVELWVDADAFEQLARPGQPDDQPLERLEAAARLYRGDYLPDDRYEDWAAERREALRDLWSTLQRRLAAEWERRGDREAASEALQRLLAEEPCNEQAGRELMRLLAEAGRRTEALRVYQRLSRALRDELGAEPAYLTVGARQRILAGQTVPPGPLDAASPAGPPTAPGPPAAAGPAGGPGGLADFVPAYPFPSPGRLIGRRAQLAQLSQVLERGRTGGQVVLVGAPAGTGKSALLGALVRQAGRAGTLCLVGGCYEQEGVTPFGPLRDALADLLLSQPPAWGLQALGGAAADLAEVVPELKPHLGLPPTPPGYRLPRARLLGAVHACLRSLAQQRPLLLCLEDLHTADAATLDLIRFLARQMHRLPLTLIGSFRSDEVRPEQQPGQLLAALLREGAELLELPPLGRDETARLLDTLLDGPPSEPLHEALFATTEGNPLFVEQLVLALREERRLDRRDGLWHQVGAASPRPPTVIRAVIGQRLERLSPRCREALTVAAVLGRAVEHEALLAALGPDDELGLLEAVDEALEARLLQETPSGYVFGHGLVREALYWGLSARRRMLLHARAGQALERLAGPRADERAAELAHHFVHGGDSQPVRGKALHYSLLAGRRAAALSSHQEALEHFSRATALLEREGERADLEARLEALEGCGHAERALWLWLPLIADFQRVLELASDPLRRGQARDAIGYARQQTGDTAAAMANYEQALVELAPLEDQAEAVVPRFRVQTARAYLWFLQGRFLDMEREGQRMLERAEAQGRPLLLFWAHNALALARMGQGRIAAALEHGDRAVEAAVLTGDRTELAVAEANRAIERCFGGQFAAARPGLERAAALYHEAAAERRAANALKWLGWVWLAEGEPLQARQLAEQACSLATEAQDRWAADCFDLLGRLHALAAEWEPAAECFQRALEARATVDHAAGRLESLIGLGLVCERTGDWARAEAHYASAVQVATAMDPSPFEVAARRHLGQLLWLRGEAAAVEQLERALQLAESMPESSEYPAMLSARAELNWQAADLETRRRWSEQALAHGLTAEQAVEVRLTLADLQARLGQAEPAAAQAAAALAAAERLRSPRLQGLAHLASGRNAASRGEARAAAAACETALRLFDAARTPYQRALALQQAAALAGRAPGGAARAAELLRAALAGFEALGARPARARCRALLERFDLALGDQPEPAAERGG